MSRRRRYVAVIVVLLVLMSLVDILAKLGPLGDWSPAFDVVVNLGLLAGLIAAIVAAMRDDRTRAESEPDNDY